MLDPAWIAAHHDEFDVFHIHFGFDAIEPTTMADILAELDRHGKPLVYTVHDLRNPHQPDRTDHDLLLDLLIPAAAELVTLTDGAAGEIASRWGRAATVLPHPHVLPPEHFREPRRRDNQFRLGIHAKSLRPNMDPLPLVDVIVESLPELPDARLRIDMHDNLFDPTDHWYAPGRAKELAAYGDHPQVDVVVHPYFDEPDLWDYLESLSVSVLPYRFGTHSGWLEACHDLGTAILAPDCGYYAQQRPVHTFGFGEDRFDPESLVTALHRAYSLPSLRPTWVQRRDERVALAAAHDALYARALG
jgi:glycosyltransferase involved in cell wall biosynthesis